MEKHQCVNCNKTFKQKSLLVSHLSRKTKCSPEIIPEVKQAIPEVKKQPVSEVKKQPVAEVKKQPEIKKQPVPEVKKQPVAEVKKQPEVKKQLVQEVKKQSDSEVKPIEPEFKCVGCNKTFPTKNNLAKHLKKPCEIEGKKEPVENKPLEVDNDELDEESMQLQLEKEANEMLFGDVDKCVQLEYMLRIITKHFEGRITQLEHELKQFKDNGINNTTNVAINVISHDLLEDVRKLDEMVKNCKATVNPDLQYSGYS